ncbi:hypothetical protein MS3_00009758 [Schistosoma haematobium]|uniref:Uncharacterized protein n=1 Tax=Schistosoma haematobium TaxID=6185 RepID=A0A922LDX4_SCHHA|nr:hypothetical protein MS3_00009758 [Schistosoma haematobium]KAH9579693.1 hypothetical protein MS3_00009758 [Schistosoma haematobium]
MVENNDFIAVKWYYEIRVGGTSIIAKVTNVIHSGGKISLYYENIPTELNGSPLSSTIQGAIQCGKKLGVQILARITTPGHRIRSDTLVEFEPIENVREPEITTPAELMTSDTSAKPKPIEISCSIHNSIEKCQNATTSSVKCIWYEKANICINSDDYDVKVSNCSDS